MMNSSRECRKAVNRNNAFEGNLRKDLESIEGQRKRIMRSLREKRLNFVHRKSTLPKIGFSTLEGKIPVAKSFSLDNTDLGKLCERGLLPKKRFSMPNDIEYFKTQNLLLTKPGGEKITPPSQPTISTDVETFSSQSPRLTRRTQGGSLQSEKKTALDRHRSLPGESSASEIPAWEDDHAKWTPHRSRDGPVQDRLESAEEYLCSLRNSVASFSSLANAAAFLQMFESSAGHLT